jgi:hypothetical protein
MTSTRAPAIIVTNASDETQIVDDDNGARVNDVDTTSRTRFAAVAKRQQDLKRSAPASTASITALKRRGTRALCVAVCKPLTTCVAVTARTDEGDYVNRTSAPAQPHVPPPARLNTQSTAMARFDGEHARDDANVPLDASMHAHHVDAEASVNGHVDDIMSSTITTTTTTTTVAHAAADEALERDETMQLDVDADAPFDAHNDADATLPMNTTGATTASAAAVRDVVC